MVMYLTGVFEIVNLNRIEEYLWTSDNRCAPKPGPSTDLYVYALTKSYIKYFKSRFTSMYVVFLDASKALDEINHRVLFKG